MSLVIVYNKNHLLVLYGLWCSFSNSEMSAVPAALVFAFLGHGVAPSPPLVGPCTDNTDCSLCGTCNLGVCKCDRGFNGVQCERLNMGRPFKCGDGGLCMKGEHVGSNSGVEPTTVSLAMSLDVMM